ncbi:MAG: hypothetical protein IJW96_02790 [Clostridia bacterium]|nr:hypothetical protein [Clostridia bacterium]
MKRVKAACILQTLVFSQKTEVFPNKEDALSENHREIERYKKTLEKSNTRYQILDEHEEADGSIVIHVRKQLNEKADVNEYFK